MSGLFYSTTVLDQDEPAKVGGNQEVTILKDMNELQDFQDDVWSKGAA